MLWCGWPGARAWRPSPMPLPIPVPIPEPEPSQLPAPLPATSTSPSDLIRIAADLLSDVLTGVVHCPNNAPLLLKTVTAKSLW